MDMQKRLKTTAVVIGIVIILAGVGYLARQNHNDFEKAIVTQAQFQLLSVARSEARSLGQYLTNVDQELEILADQAMIKRDFSKKYSNETAEQFSLLNDSFRDVKSLSDSLSMIDSTGTLIYAVPSQEGVLGNDLSQVPDIQTALSIRRKYVSGIFSLSGKYLIALDQPVFDQDRFIGILRSTISIEKMNALVSRLDEKMDWYSFLIDAKGVLLSYPDVRYIGKNIASLLNENHASLRQCRVEGILKQMQNGKEGADICQFFPLGNVRSLSDMLIAFVPVRLGESVWFVTEAMNYDTIAGPVNRNARDNIAFAGFVILVLSLSGGFFYWHQKKKADEIQLLYARLAKSHAQLQSTQSLLIQAEKMQIVGKLASGVAHEVKNPLATILQGVEYLKEKVRSDDPNVTMFLNDIEAAIIKADSIIRGLLDFSSVTKLDMNREDIHAIIDLSLALLKNLCDNNHITVRKEFDSSLPLVAVDRNKIEQVLMNLMLNAIQAMPGGGTLLIKTSVSSFNDSAKAVLVQIEDTGPGIREADMKNLFEPFFTTKRAIGGTGLGLSIVKNIVEMHGGKITIANKEEGAGVRVTVTLKA